MTPHDVFLAASKRGLRLEPAGQRLAVFPKGKCPADFAEILRQHKPDLLKWLSSPLCPGWRALPPEDLSLNPIKPDPAPRDRDLVTAYIVRQTNGHAGELSAWLRCREHAYCVGSGQTWTLQQVRYAVARDAACWQLQKSETQLWETLAGFDESYEKRPRRI